MRDIIPKNKIKGVDIFGDYDFTYIIRSDLGCYMRTSDLHKGSDLTIFNLHPSCQHGDHYLVDFWGRFYIIKGKSYRRVSDLSTDANAEVKDLHPDFQGADHYITCDMIFFYAIYQAIGINKYTLELCSNQMAGETKLHPNNNKGLYYWTGRQYHCFLKPVSEWGVEFFTGTTGTNLDKPDGKVYSVHPDVVNFLPGGLSITQGPAFGRWENIKTVRNNSDTPLSWHKKIIKKVGYNKEKTKEITHNWKFGASATIESGAIASLIVKFQMSFSIEYGGSTMNTEKESWNEAIEEEEALTVELQPYKNLYLWQYRLCLGKEPVLFCRDLIRREDPNPPTEVPLPPAK